MVDQDSSLIPNDPRSVELDGDIVPIDDVLPDYRIETLDTDSQPDPDEGESDEFIKARDIIEAGILASVNKPEIEVEFWKADKTYEGGGHKVTMSLSQFFGGMSLRHMVSETEFNVLYERYKDKNEQHVAKALGNVAVTPAAELAHTPEVEVVPEPQPEAVQEPDVLPEEKPKLSDAQIAAIKAYDEAYEIADRKFGSRELVINELESKGIFPPEGYDG